MKIEFNKVTWYSKLLEVLVFVIAVVLAFFFGTYYAENNYDYLSATDDKIDVMGEKYQVDGLYNEGVDRVKTYNDPQGRFSFDYPSQYYLNTAENNTIMITSAPVPLADEEKCKKYDDRQLYVACMNPSRDHSPNIKFQYVEGDSRELIAEAWEGLQIIPDRPGIFETKSGQWTYYTYMDEYGGSGRYLLPMREGVIKGSYSHIDVDGGIPFTNLQSDIYLLDNIQQRELFEDIIKSFEVKN